MNKKLRKDFEDHKLIGKRADMWIIDEFHKPITNHGRFFRTDEAQRQYRKLRNNGLTSIQAARAVVLVFGDDCSNIKIT